jgi:hypothetical protein
MDAILFVIAVNIEIFILFAIAVNIFSRVEENAYLSAARMLLIPYLSEILVLPGK